MRKIFFLAVLLFFFIITYGYSQNDPESAYTHHPFWRKTDSLYKKNQFKISPPRLIRLEYPGIEFIYERRYTKRLSTQISLRYLTDLIINKKTNYKGAGFSIEEKFFLEPLKFQKPYISMEVVADKYSSVEEAMFINPDSLRYHSDYPDRFTVEKQAMSLNLKCGIQMFIFKGIVADFSIGPGIKYRNVVHKNRSVPSDILEPPIESFNSVSISEGRYYCGNLSFTVRIGYAF